MTDVVDFVISPSIVHTDDLSAVTISRHTVTLTGVVDFLILTKSIDASTKFWAVLARHAITDEEIQQESP